MLFWEKIVFIYDIDILNVIFLDNFDLDGNCGFNCVNFEIKK